MATINNDDSNIVPDYSKAVKSSIELCDRCFNAHPDMWAGGIAFWGKWWRMCDQCFKKETKKHNDGFVHGNPLADFINADKSTD